MPNEKCEAVSKRARNEVRATRLARLDVAGEDAGGQGEKGDKAEYEDTLPEATQRDSWIDPLQVASIDQSTGDPREKGADPHHG